MPKPKETFLKQKELSSYLLDTVNSGKFNQCLVYVRAELMEGSLSAEQLSGAKLFEQTLLTLASQEPDSMEFAGPGLHHDLDLKRKTDLPQKQTK